MGIFDGLFKPNVEKLKEKMDVEGLLKALDYKDKNVRLSAAEALGKLKSRMAIDPLIRAMKDNDSYVRKEAAKALGEIKDNRAIDPLIRALKDNDSDVRKEAAKALGEIKDEKAIGPLTLALGDSNEHVRLRVAEALGKIGKTPVELLIQALKDINSRVRFGAAEALDKIGWQPKDDAERIQYLIAKHEWNELVTFGELAVEPLIRTLEYENRYTVYTRKEAAKALGQIKDKRAVEPLCRALKDEIVEVRKEAINALGRIGEPGVESLCQALKDENYEVRKEAIKALGRIGEPGVESLCQALKDENYEVQKEAAKALGQIKDKGAVEPLIPALGDESHVVREGAAKALRTIGWEPKDDVERTWYLIAMGEWKELARIGEPAVEPLCRALKDEIVEVRKEAAKALGQIGEPGVESLCQALKDENYEVQKEAINALGQIGEPGVESLCQALKDENYEVQKEAAKALGQIKDKGAVEPLLRCLENESGWEAVEALVMIGDLRAAEAIIKYLFNRGYLESDRTRGSFQLGSCIRSRDILFGDYTTLIIDASMNIEKKEGEDTNPGSEYQNFKIHYDLCKSNDAIPNLCNISTQIANNILHEVSQRKDIEVAVAWSCIQYLYGTLSFQSQREMAKNELKRRGYPPYDPSAYLKKDAWKLDAGKL